MIILKKRIETENKKVSKSLSAILLIFSIFSILLNIILKIYIDFTLSTAMLLNTFFSIPFAVYIAYKKLLYLRKEYRTLRNYQYKNGCYAISLPIGKVKGIVIHSSVIKNPYLKRYVDFEEELGKNTDNNHWNKTGSPLMPHGFIGIDKMDEVAIVNTLFYKRATVCCGKGNNGSYDSEPYGHLQIIVCEDEENDFEYFNEAVFGATVQYCLRLCRKFKLKPESIISDKEAYDVGFASKYSNFDEWLKSNNKNMDDLREAVKAKRKKEWLKLGDGLGEDELERDFNITSR